MIDGPTCGNGLEFYPTSNNQIKVIFAAPNGMKGIILAHYTEHDTWAIGIAQFRENMPLPTTTITIHNQDGYSVLLVIETEHDLTFEGNDGQ